MSIRKPDLAVLVLLLGAGPARSWENERQDRLRQWRRPHYQYYPYARTQGPYGYTLNPNNPTQGAYGYTINSNGRTQSAYANSAPPQTSAITRTSLPAVIYVMPPVPPAAPQAGPPANPAPDNPAPSYPPPQPAAQPVVLPAAAAAPAENPFGAPAGPAKPPLITEFSDTFVEAVQDYVKAKSKKNDGVFVVKDDLTGEPHFLKLSRVHRETVTEPSLTAAHGFADFEAVNGLEKVQLDFFLEKDGWWSWSVAKVLVHSVDGRPRYYYNSDGEIVRLGAKPAALEDKPKIPKPKQPPALAAEAIFHEPSGLDRLEAGETGGISVIVANSGKGPAYDVHLVSRVYPPVPGLEVASDVAAGEIAPGSSAQVEIPLSAADAVATRKARLTVEVKEGNGFDAEPLLMEFDTKALEPAKLELNGLALLTGPVVNAGEPTRIRISVANSGAGTARDVSATLLLGSPDLFMGDEPTVRVGELLPGEFKDAEFEFFVNKRFPSGVTLPISLSVADGASRAGAVKIPLNLVLGKPAPGPAAIVVASKDAAPEDVDAPPKARTKDDPKAFAVVVGLERYRDLPGVDYARRDSQAVYDYLTRAMGFSPKNVVLLQNERATLTDLTTYLGPWLADRVDGKSRVFVYFSGHGAPDARTGEGYLIPYDGSPVYTETKAYSIKRLYDALAELPARNVTAVLDSCFSGAGGRSVTVPGARPLTMMARPPPVGANTFVLTAAQSDQISVGYPEARHGLLTYYLLKGLHGAAADREGRVSTARLLDYLVPAVRSEAKSRHVEQTPSSQPPAERLGDKAGRVWLELK